MLMMRILFVILTFCSGLFLAGSASAQSAQQTAWVDGIARTYWLHVPTRRAGSAPMPVVLVFHGGGGQGYGTQRFTHFNAIADREGFLAAYPDGIDRHWHDGRRTRDGATIDDVEFVRAVISQIGRDYPIDPRRIYATGISNGAIFSHFLAMRLSEQIAAIAPVAGGIALEVARDFHPASPVSVLVIQGTSDPLVPFAGGPIPAGRGGAIISTADAVKLWLRANQCGATAERRELPDKDPNDGCRAQQETWSGGMRGSEVSLITVSGGGHTWPGGTQYLPKWLIGPVCRDFDASEEIWSFFARHPKR